MKKTMIYLPEETHEGLKRLAFEARTSIAELIRRPSTRHIKRIWRISGTWRRSWPNTVPIPAQR